MPTTTAQNTEPTDPPVNLKSSKKTTASARATTARKMKTAPRDAHSALVNPAKPSARRIPTSPPKRTKPPKLPPRTPATDTKPKEVATFAEKAKSYNRTRTGLWTLSCSIRQQQTLGEARDTLSGVVKSSKDNGIFRGKKARKKRSSTEREKSYS